MKLEKTIVDADFCIKVGASAKYRYLEKVLPALANKAYILEPPTTKVAGFLLQRELLPDAFRHHF